MESHLVENLIILCLWMMSILRLSICYCTSLLFDRGYLRCLGRAGTKVLGLHGLS